ncbi:MAG: Asp-tRNA(Asn)/Glu-tRNA(Gln) amidotransferase GatCAB subunit C [Candidatus Zambryskibacteria bacterium CG11_big_fil_rev_8_21_14_0_20_42_18]|uniref:Asp-tRNA(Asn)/Glu-tRNA(Gln) amidotransferase GatCAB subunit C n=1 Tax=Candidatus Zambryskibacteria bacterium CG_4_9_14_3_um_filter_42_15 TaxID=1975112 RepID=A0A2M7WRB8_9BACT|nr:MAG: Asp-tRNA(Asn)/Glu-tRNA(Gln) amidotransferase GatCAB subunit C [Candidatus Zambryskibacteria bacterium CG11_big_fil_rev_8_21_14_0_20_42_18]PJA32552.1 MAG: Asp-tRNA(Asn)/Glu-tRNA(Gln) amidotransferase GatCAB subunit C [Candidatus Zambryskibacteria bacterium CG_4_9_14_3_um_filter_42_15]
MDKEQVRNLAKLARIELKDEEAENLTHEFEAILDYVGEVKEVTDNFTPPSSGGASKLTTDDTLRNVFREDSNPHETGIYTKAVLEQAPMKAGNYIKVKKIL